MGFVIDDESINLDKESRLPLIGLYSTFKELKILAYAAEIMYLLAEHY